VLTRSLSPYHQELNEFRLAYSRAGAIVGAILILSGLGLDYTLYPDDFMQLARIRVLAALAVLAVYLVLRRTSLALRWTNLLTLLWLSVPQIMISWMIWATDGTSSIYFVGLLLALYATGILLPLSFVENIAFGIFTYALYFLACYFHPHGLTDLGRFAGYSIFVVFSAVLSSFCTYFNERGRANLFNLQRQVAEKNTSLQETNAALAEVKGHLIQQEKMAALGTLSAGLLHELNNPVNYSLMAVNMALKETAARENPSLRECLDDAREGMQRVQKIVSDLKTFAYQKPGEEGNRVFLLEKAIESALRLTGYELKNIDVSLDLPQDTHVRGDEPAIIGVLINLLSNAAVALRTAARPAPRIELRARPLDGRLELALRDNGTGIAAQNLGRVFEPFFTTRDVGQGLGLGLSVSYAIIQRHGGALRVASEWGEGTEFSFDLALASPQP
jgi:two-component system, sensor histidine kinase PhcS